MGRKNENRPESLFYRLLKYILKTDPGVKSFIHLVSIYMINRIFTDKTFSEPDELVKGGNDEKGGQQVMSEANLIKKRDGIIEFVEIMFEKLIEGTLDIDDHTQRKFEMPRIESRNQNIYNFKQDPEDPENIEAYQTFLPLEMINFIERTIEILKRKFPNEMRLYLMYSKILKLIFEEVMETIDNFQFQLIPYIKHMELYMKIKQDLHKTHFHNLRNIFELFISIISHQDAFTKDENFGRLFEEVNNEIKRGARSKIESIYFNFIERTRGYKPELVLFQKLVIHSFDHQKVRINFSIKNFLKIYELCQKFPKIIFGREESDFDILYNKLKSFNQIPSIRMFGEKRNKIQLELKTQIFAEPFRNVKRCQLCNACLSSKYSQPIHKNLINNFIPSDPSILHSVYSSLLRISDIDTSKYHDIQDFLEDSSSHIVKNFQSSQNIKKAKDKILSSIKKDWNKYGKKDNMTELEFADKIHSDNYIIIEEEIKRRNTYFTYLKFVF